MTILRLSTKTIASTAVVALLLGFAPLSAHAQGSVTNGSSSAFLDSNNLRTIRDVPAIDSSTGASATTYQGNPGCNSTVLTSVGNSANYSASQAIAVHVNVMQQPTSFSNCIGGLIQNISKYTNFLSGGLSFSVIINDSIQSALKELVTNLEGEACAAATNALTEFSSHGSVGAASLDFSKLSSGQSVVVSLPNIPGPTSNNSKGFYISASGIVKP